MQVIYTLLCDVLHVYSGLLLPPYTARWNIIFSARKSMHWDLCHSFVDHRGVNNMHVITHIKHSSVLFIFVSSAKYSLCALKSFVPVYKWRGICMQLLFIDNFLPATALGRISTSFSNYLQLFFCVFPSWNIFQDMHLQNLATGDLQLNPLAYGAYLYVGNTCLTQPWLVGHR